MNKIFRIVSIFLGILLSLNAEGQDTIYNFENGLNGFNVHASGTLTASIDTTADFAYSGERSLEIEITNSGSGNVQLVAKTMHVEPNDRFIVRFYMCSNQNRAVDVKYQYQLVGGGYHIATISSVNVDNNWKKIEVDVTVPKDIDPEHVFVGFIELNISNVQGLKYYVDQYEVNFLPPLPSDNKIPDLFYVSVGGDDSANGSFESPFKTIQKAATLAGTGDTIWIRAGTYRETVIPTYVGASDQPLVFKAYPGEKVVISGGDLLTGWTNTGNDIWEAPMQSSLVEYRNQLFVNGKSMIKARWPNVKDDNPLTPEGAVCDQPNCSMSQLKAIEGFPESWTSSSLDGAAAWVMAQSKWRAWNSEVTSYDPGSQLISVKEITTDWYVENMNPGLKGPLQYGPSIFVLSGSRGLLDAPNEWWFDQENRKVLIIPPVGVRPDNIGVYIESKVRDYGFVLDNRSFIQIEGINFRGTAISMKESMNCTLKDLYFYEFDYREGVTPEIYQSRGIIVSGTENVVRDSEFERCSDAGVTLLGTGNSMINCYLHEVDYAGFDGGPINLYGQKHLVSHNTVEKVSRRAIAPGGLSHLIQYNHLREVGLTTRDLAAIYSTGESGNTVIRYNWVNVTNGNPEAYGGGIYFDNWHQNVIVHRNIIWNITTSGLIINRPGNYGVWAHNTCEGQIRTSYGPWIGQESLHGTLVHNNWSTDAIDEGDYIWSKMNNKITLKSELNISFENGTPVVNSNSGGEDEGTFLPGINDGYNNERPDIGAIENGNLIWNAGHDFENPPYPEYEEPSFYYRNYVINGGFDYQRVYISPRFSHYHNWNKTDGKYSTVEYFSGFNFPAADERNSIHGNSLHLKGSNSDGIEQVISNLPVGHFVFSSYVRLVSPTSPGADVYLSVHKGGDEVAGEWASETDLFGSQEWRMVKVRFRNTEESEFTVKITKAGDGEAYIDNIGLVPEYADDPFAFVTDTSDIVFQVRDSILHQAIPGCTITFNRTKYQTDENGNLTLNNVLAGKYSLLVEKGGYEDYLKEELEVSSDSTYTINLEVEKHTLSIQALDRSTSLPIYRASVNFDDEDIALTSHTGLVSLIIQAGKELSFSLNHEDYFAYEDSVIIAGDTTLRVFMTKKLANIFFKIKDESGLPLENATVSIGTWKVLSNSSGEVFFFGKPARTQYVYSTERNEYESNTDTFYLETDTIISVQLYKSVGVSTKLDATEQLKVYPNPVSDILYIDLPGELNFSIIQITDILGKTYLFKPFASNPAEIDVSKLTDGFYVLKIIGKEIYIYRKIIIDR